MHIDIPLIDKDVIDYISREDFVSQDDGGFLKFK